MKKHTYLAVAAMAGMMFVGQGAMAQQDRAADRSNQQSSTGDSAGAASSQDKSSQDSAEKRSQTQSDDASTAGARAGQGRSQGQQSKDQKFVEFASTNDQFEIQAAKLAEQQASDDQIKQMAKMIQQDHQECSQKLQQAAQQAGVQVSSQLKPHQQAMLQELRQMQGEDFDKAWLYGQVAGHTKAVLKFRDASKDLQNPQLKQFAAQTLPKLQQHLQHAQKMAQYDEASAQTAGARERATGSDSSTPAAGDRSGTTPRTSRDASGAGSTGGSNTAGGTDSNPNRNNDTGSGASSDSASGGRSPSK